MFAIGFIVHENLMFVIRIKVIRYNGEVLLKKLYGCGGHF